MTKGDKLPTLVRFEVQAVYISGNVRQPFEHYMADRENRRDMVWTSTHVRADYLSSSRKRLAPQMLYKGSILKAWGKKQGVVLHRAFYDTLPSLPESAPDEADVIWLVYDLQLRPEEKRYELVPYKTIYTQFGQVVRKITTPEAGPVDDFMAGLQKKLDEKLEDQYPPDAPTLTDIIDPAAEV